MVNFGFSSETGHKYENYSSQSHAGTIGVVSIFNSIVLVILLAPGKFQNFEFWFFFGVFKKNQKFPTSQNFEMSKIPKFQNQVFSIEKCFGQKNFDQDIFENILIYFRRFFMENVLNTYVDPKCPQDPKKYFKNRAVSLKMRKSSSNTITWFEGLTRTLQVH